MVSSINNFKCYVNVMIFCKGNINIYIKFDSISSATYFFHVRILDTFFFFFFFFFFYQENLNVQLLNDFLVMKQLLPNLFYLDRIIPIYIYIFKKKTKTG